MNHRETCIFIRNYLPPASGRSKNAQGGELKGVSAYFCVCLDAALFRAEHDCDWKLRLDIENFTATAKHLDQAPNPFFPFGTDDPKHIFYLVNGNQIGIGHDTEPVLTHLELLCPLVYEVAQNAFRPATAAEQERLHAHYGEAFLRIDEPAAE